MKSCNVRPLPPVRLLAAGLLGVLTGCQEGAGPVPLRPGSAAAPLEEGARLSDRPLYAYTEAELDAYLPIARRAVPSLDERAVALGRQNIGQPYQIYLLGEFPFELHDPDPLYALDRSDCLTFCEHMYALALAEGFWDFLRILQRLRYRDGEISMLTRNHYTIADWNRNNAFLFVDITANLGDGGAAVPLRQLCRRAQFFAKFGLGQDVADEPIEDCYVPKLRLPEVLEELRGADFVNIIRGDAESQWCGHTGLIALAKDGAVSLLHSARPAVREEPLLEYVNADERCLGVKILRLRPGAERVMRAVLANSPRATDVSPAALRAAYEQRGVAPPAWP